MAAAEAAGRAIPKIAVQVKRPQQGVGWPVVPSHHEDRVGNVWPPSAWAESRGIVYILLVVESGTANGLSKVA